MQSTSTYTRQEKENLIRKHAGYQTPLQIAAICGMTVQSVYNYGIALKISFKLKNPEEKFKPVKDFIRANYTSMTCREAADKVNISPQRMYSYAKTIGLRFLPDKPVVKPQPVNTSRMFNVRERKDWIAGFM